MSALATALRRAAHGWPVLPIHNPEGGRCSCGRHNCSSPAKHPRTLRGLSDATRDPDTVRAWWRAWPEANLGVRTGTDAGLVVLDVDGTEGADSLRELECDHGALPRTTTVVTPSGGQHFYFRHPGQRVPNSVAALGPALDMRGDNGYVLIPPSAAVNGRRYEVHERTKPAPLPPWLLERVVAQKPNGTRKATPAGVWLGVVGEGASEGQRNDSLARLVGHLLRRYVDVDLTAELAHLLNQERFRPPLPASEVDQILDSIAWREAQRREGSA